MPELQEQMYCSQQIVIPPKFPYILKRFCKAAIKTQPYDLLRWSFEYFKALAEHRPPPVKLRLEYPIFSTEGGLTRGCLKVLAHQFAGTTILPIQMVKDAWQGFCLDPEELTRILCLCEVYLRENEIHLLNFIAVAGALLTKCLTHTMILLCETLTKEPDGGSAAICVYDFVKMYKFLAKIDASKDVKYLNGYREGQEPSPPSTIEETEEVVEPPPPDFTMSQLKFWDSPSSELLNVMVLNDCVAKTAKISEQLTAPIIGKLSRSPSVERANEMEREKFQKDWKGRTVEDEEVNKQLRTINGVRIEDNTKAKSDAPKEKESKEVEIRVFDDEDNPLPLEFYGEPVEGEEEEVKEKEVQETQTKTDDDDEENVEEEITHEEILTEKEKLQMYLNECYEDQINRLLDLEKTFEEIENLVNRYKSLDYDLGTLVGRQMSITSGEFIVTYIEKEIMDYVDEQIAILPDPALKKRKAKPEEVAMVRELVDEWLDENMDVIVPDLEEEHVEEEAIPEVTNVYAVPGIGPRVDEEIIFEVCEYAMDVAKVQADVFMPRNIRHFMCPPLEKFVECNYDGHNVEKKKLEMV